MAVRLEKALPLQYASQRDAVKIARHFSAGNQARRKKLVPLGTIEDFRESTSQPSLTGLAVMMHPESRH